MTTIFGIPANVVYATAGVYALLILASAIVWMMSRRDETGHYRELKDRVRSWWWMIGAFTLAMLASRTVAIVFLGFISYLALKEYLSLIPTRRIDRSVLLFAYLAIPLQFYWAAIDWYGMFIVFIPVWMFLVFPALMALRGETQGFLRAVGTLSWGLMMTVFTLSHMAMLLVSGDAENPIAGGLGLLFFLVMLTQFNDVAQYTWGKLTGRHKVTPTVSPKKTWEGLIGGIATTTLLAASDRPLPHADGLALVGACRAHHRRLGLPRRHHHVGDEARPRREGYRRIDPGSWRHSRPRRQPHLCSAGVHALLPLLLLPVRRER